MDVSDFVRAALAWHFTFVAVFYTAKLIGVRERTGITHADPGPRGTTQYVAHRTFRVFRALIWSVCVLRAFDARVDTLLVPFEAVAVAPVLITGLGLIGLSFAWIVYVHSFMGADWRSGVAGGGPARLLSDGPFRFCRHPMFCGVIVGQFGFALALPSLFSTVCLVVGVTVILAQARHEDGRLAEHFGPAWEAYAARTPAFWPRLTQPRSLQGDA